jgi:alcohol dehydrogenase class IV
VIKYYFKVTKLPEFKELSVILKEVEKFKPDIILAIGGGAVIDYAKIVSIVDYRLSKNLKFKLVNYENISKRKIYPLVAVPTTAGAGAEATSNAVIYINKIKYSVENSLLIPEYFFLFSNLIINNPFNLKSSAGFDAIAQGVESLISMKSNKSSVSFAKKSLKLSLNNYLSFLHKPNNENSKNMLFASHLAGKAINISKTTGPHAVSYPFSAMFGLDHGHAVSLTIEKFLLFNFKNINHSKSKFNLLDRYKIIFKLFDVTNIGELNDKIKFFKRKAKLIDDYSKLGININKSMNKILNQISELRLKNNPIRVKKNDIREILND